MSCSSVLDLRSVDQVTFTATESDFSFSYPKLQEKTGRWKQADPFSENTTGTKSVSAKNIQGTKGIQDNKRESDILEDLEDWETGNTLLPLSCLYARHESAENTSSFK